MIGKFADGNSSQRADRLLYHNWRNSETSAELESKLQQLGNHSNAATAEKVTRSLGNGEVDVLLIGDGFMVLMMPYIANNFLDDFFLGLIS